MLTQLIIDPFGTGGPFYVPAVPKHVLQATCETFNGEPCSLFLKVTALMSGDQLNKKKPPAYPMDRISVPVAIFSSEGDT
ncbi:hypothetical protein MTO96_036527, partial [Rhipicephalus appendiculatus]